MSLQSTGNPFDTLPSQLFNILGTGSFVNLQRHHLAVLLRIYDLAEFNRFGLTREMVEAGSGDPVEIGPYRVQAFELVKRENGRHVHI